MLKETRKTADGLKAKLAAKSQQLTEERKQYERLICQAEEKARAAQAALETAENGTDPQAYVRAKGALSAAQDEREFYVKKREQLNRDGILGDAEYNIAVQDIQAAALAERQIAEKDIRGLARRMAEIASAHDADIEALNGILAELADLKPNKPTVYANVAGPSGILTFADRAGKWEATISNGK